MLTPIYPRKKSFLMSASFTLQASRSHHIGIVAAQSLYLNTAHELLPCRCSNLDS
jgi:hypothetical protein